MTKNITVGVSDELAIKMEQYPEVNWSAVTRKSIEKYIEDRNKERKG